MTSVDSKMLCLQCAGGIGSGVFVGSGVSVGGGVAVGYVSVNVGSGAAVISVLDVGVAGDVVQPVTRATIVKRKTRFFMVDILPFIRFLPVGLMILAIGSS
jgi:hypothetical protein